MAGAITDRVAMRYVKEGSFGVTPTGDLTGATVSTDQATRKYSAAEGLDAFVPGQTVLIAGFSNTESNGYKTVVSASATELVVKETVGANEADVVGVSIRTAMKELRFTGESLAQGTDTVESQEIRDDRQVTDVVRTNRNAAGDVNIELSYGSFDDLLVAALCAADWSDEVSQTAATYSMDSGDNSINDSGSGFVAAGYAANQWVQISGFTEAANNGFFKIVSVAAGKMVLSGGAVADEASGDNVTVKMGGQIVNGTTDHSFSLEREYGDLDEELALLKGFVVNGLSLNAQPEQIITGSFGFMGRSEESKSTSASLGAPEAAPSSGVMNGVDNVTGFLEGGSSVSLLSLGFQLANNARERKVLGTLGPESMGKGKVGVTGTAEVYYADSSLMDKYLNFTASSLAALLQDADGNGYVIDFPRIKYTSGRRVAGNPNADIVADMGFTAYRHPDEDVTVRIARFPAA